MNHFYIFKILMKSNSVTLAKRNITCAKKVFVCMLYMYYTCITSFSNFIYLETSAFHFQKKLWYAVNSLCNTNLTVVVIFTFMSFFYYKDYSFPYCRRHKHHDGCHPLAIAHTYLNFDITNSFLQFTHHTNTHYVIARDGNSW